MAAVDEDAADGDAVAADPLGDRVHHDVRAKLDRAGEVRRRKCVVDQQRNAGVVRDLRDSGNVEHFKTGIADGLADHELGVWLDRGAVPSRSRGLTKVVVMPKRGSVA